MNVVIYARFSCKRQTEQSIEGQLKICYEYAAAHNYTVVGEYIDRAQSGTSDNRSDFQRMIADSDKHTLRVCLSISLTVLHVTDTTVQSIRQSLKRMV